MYLMTKLKKSTMLSKALELVETDILYLETVPPDGRYTHKNTVERTRTKRKVERF
jgi:hypothetical protein